MQVKQVTALNTHPVGLSQELRILQEQKELYRDVDRVFRLELTHYSNIEIISS
jgi:hypothetical protein